MICTSCQSAQAVVFIKQILNNQVTQSALCSACAGESEATLDTSQALLKFLGGTRPKPKSVAAHCPNCRGSFAQFKEGGLLGCAYCYEHFEPLLRGLIPRFQAGASVHRGKIPRRHAA